MNARDQTPAQALQRCLDALLSEMQAHWLRATADDSLLELFDRLAAVSIFLTNKNSARRCQTLCQDWLAQYGTTDAGRDRLVLRAMWQCRESLQGSAPEDVLRQLLIDDIRAALDSVTVCSGNADAEQAWLRETGAHCAAIGNATHFLANAAAHRPGTPPQTIQALLGWMIALNESLSPENTNMIVPWVFRRELARCLERCQRTGIAQRKRASASRSLSPELASGLKQELKQELWQLQSLAGAVLAVGSMRPNRHARQVLRQHCHGLIVAAAQAQHQPLPPDLVTGNPIREVMRHALLLSTLGELTNEDESDTLAQASAGVLTSAALPAAAVTPMQELVAVIVHDSGGPADWPALSLRLYRLLVCLRLLGGGFVDAGISYGQHPGLVQWQLVIASLHASVNHCLQQSVVTREDQAGLLDLLRRLADGLQAQAGPDTPDYMHRTLLLAARLGLRAQRHWQQLTLELDAVQDFAGVSVPHVLAAELHFLPGMDGSRPRASVLPQDVLRDLRLLLKGARILNVQRIESLVFVLSELYQEIVDCPAFAESAEVSKVLSRAHRSLCRMLDQAAAWQTPGNARRMINSLYACLESWRGECGVIKVQAAAGVNERPAGQDNDPWRVCLSTNRRLRQLLQHQNDLDGIRVLLLELLRSQEDLIRRQADYSTALDTP